MKKYDLKLVEPNATHQVAMEKFKQDIIDEGLWLEGCGNFINEDFSTWLKNCDLQKCGKNLPSGMTKRTQYILLRVSDEKVIGTLEIRELDKQSIERNYGHVGYCVAIDERNKGYGRELLRLACEIFKKDGTQESIVIMTVDDNVASQKTVISNGGVYTGTVTDHNDASIKLHKYILKM